MKDQTKEKIVYFVLFVAVLLVSCFLLILIHEVVHQTIYKNYGIDSDIYPGTSKMCHDATACTVVSNMTQYNNLKENYYQEYRDMESLHMMNEIVSYPLILFLVIFITILFVLLAINRNLVEIGERGY